MKSGLNFLDDVQTYKTHLPYSKELLFKSSGFKYIWRLCIYRSYML